MRSVQDGGVEPGRLDRVLAAMRDQRAAEKGDRRDAIEKAEFAERIGEVDVEERTIGSPALRWATLKPRAASALRIAEPRGGWRGAMIVRRPGWRCRSSWCAAATISSSPSWVLAATHTGRLPMERRKAATAAGSAAGGGTSNLRLPVTATWRDAEQPVAFAVVLALGEAEVDSREERAGGAAEAVPATKGPLGEAGIDEDLRDAGAGELHDRRRPQLGLDEERDVRPPVSEEAADPGGDVDRQELVDGPVGQCGSRRRSPRSR